MIAVSKHKHFYLYFQLLSRKDIPISVFSAVSAQLRHSHFCWMLSFKKCYFGKKCNNQLLVSCKHIFLLAICISSLMHCLCSFPTFWVNVLCFNVLCYWLVRASHLLRVSTLSHIYHVHFFSCFFYLLFLLGIFNYWFL